MRLDRQLVDRGDAHSRTVAARLIAEGRVSVNGTVVVKASHDVRPEDEVLVALGAGPQYVSRAGHKLAGALAAFPSIVVQGRRCLDAGASTGGFTQVLLEAGASHVAAVDVGHGQLNPLIRDDPRVEPIEGLNVRNLRPEHIGGQVDLTVGDLSFISLTLVIQPLADATVWGGELILMVKPQFEVGKSKLGKGGVVRNDTDRAAAIQKVRDCALEAGLDIAGEQPSQLPGQDGNREYFLHLRKPALGEKARGVSGTNLSAGADMSLKCQDRRLM